MTDIPVIEVQNVRRRYGGRGQHGFDAVRDVSFQVGAGELFALLGTNGAGKTSTVEVLEGLARPSAGAVRVLGLDPFEQRRLLRRRIGIMLQDGGFPSGLKVAEVVRMWAGTMTSPRPIGEAMELVGLTRRAKVSISHLSGGEKRRLELAVAILGNPEVLFLDEPSAGLDPQSRQATWLLVRELLAGGTTVVLTTHYLQEAEELADRLAILHQGRIVRSGSPAEVAGSQPDRISFTVAGPAGRPLPNLPGSVALERSLGAYGSQILIRTTDTPRTLAALLSWADSTGLALGDLQVRPVSLEEAFLAVARSSTVNEESPEVAA